MSDLKEIEIDLNNNKIQIREDSILNYQLKKLEKINLSIS